MQNFNKQYDMLSHDLQNRTSVYYRKFTLNILKALLGVIFYIKLTTYKFHLISIGSMSPFKILYITVIMIIFIMWLM